MAKLLGFIVPLVAFLVSIPMILDKVPPNSTYGFRTAKTLSSPEVWYPANRAAGWFVLGAAVISICFNLALWWGFPEWRLTRTLFWMNCGTMVAFLMSALASLIYLGRL